jgi:hypothetical protein
MTTPEESDGVDAVCAFPGCTAPRSALRKTGKGNRPLHYCDDPRHNAKAAYEARQRRQAGVIETQEHEIQRLRDELAALAAALAAAREQAA